MSDAHVLSVVAAHTPASDVGLGHAAAIMPHIQQWANGHNFELVPSGSRAKNTAIKGGTDLDVFISLDPSVRDSNTLEWVYTSLRDRMAGAGYNVREQNVSLGIQLGGLSIDLVPGVLHDRRGTDHSLHKHKEKSWTKTNVHEHIRYVVESGRVFDIRAVKVWRKLWGLEFPAFYLELSVIEALKGRQFQPAANFVEVLRYIQDELPTRRIVDPSNSANVVSDELTSVAKTLLADAARRALGSNWDQVLWA